MWAQGMAKGALCMLEIQSLPESPHHLALAFLSKKDGRNVSQGPLVACLYRPYRCSKASVLRVSLPATDATIAAAASNASSRSVACSSGPSMRRSLFKPGNTVFRCFERFLDVTQYRRTAL